MSRHSLYQLTALACTALWLLPEAQGQVRVYRSGAGSAERSAQSSAAMRDPREVYASAYYLCRESENLARQQSYNAAIRKGQEAEKIFASILRDYPNWKTELVNARRRLLAENLANYRKQAASSAATAHKPSTGINVELPGTAKNGLSDDYEPIPLPNYATTDKKLYNALARAQEECRNMAKAYRELNNRLTETQKKLVAAQMEQNMYKERYEQLREQVSSERRAGNSVVDSLSRQLAEMEAKYHASESALRDTQARSAELEVRLTEVQDSLERVTKERDALYQENEQLRAIVELNSPEKTKALLDQNLTLAEQLKAAQERIHELESLQSGSNDQNAVLTQQLDEARAEAARLRDELSSIYDENMGYRKRISELTEQLNNLEADLAHREEQPVVDPALAEENRLLREIIDKQKRTLAMQEESRRLLLETYKALKNNDPDVENALRRLQEESSLELTTEERQFLEQVRQSRAQNEEESSAARRTMEVSTLADLAEKAFSKGRYMSAEQLYLTLYDLQPDHVAGLVNLATILLHNNKSDEATQYLARAIRLSPDTAICYYLAGIAHYQLEQMQEAQKMFSRTVQLDPGNAEAFFYLANIESLSGSYERALKHYAAAVKIRPELADAHYNMARLYVEMSKIPEAARSYDRAIRNGAMPDLEFEEYLRQHPNHHKKPGIDLVESVKPEEEARRLDSGKKEEDAQKAPAPQKETPAAPAKQTPPDFHEQVEQITAPVKTVSTPSPASAGHETKEERFSSIRMKTRNGMRPLRLKRPEPQRLRTRGQEEIEMLKNASKTPAR